MKFRWIKIIAASVFVVAGLSAQGTTVESYLLNRDGLKKFEQKSYFPAYRDFIQALDSDPLNPMLHLNIARAFEASEDFEKAEQAYKAALQLMPADEGLRFQTLFNLAGVQAKQKKIDEALMNYQAALEIIPESKEVKTNIELLWQGGEGGGEGESDDQQESDKSKEGSEKRDQQKNPGQPEKKKPQKFQGQNLTPNDVKKILDEIKNQEQGIRAQEYEKGAKEAPRGKDW